VITITGKGVNVWKFSENTQFTISKSSYVGLKKLAVLPS
jgi:hypothetical protein